MANEANKKIATKVIKEEYPGISQSGIDSILANIEIETGFNKFVEIPQDYDAVMANSDLVSMQGNLNSLTGGKAEYDALSDREKLGVLYQGDKDAKYAGGIGGLQLTSANYGGLGGFEAELDTIAGTLNMSSEDLYDKAKTDPETAIRLSIVHLRDIKGVNTQELNVSNGESLRKDYINPHETQGVATSAQQKRTNIFQSYSPQVAGTSTTVTRAPATDITKGGSTEALIESLKTATDESSGKRKYTVTDGDLEVVDSAERTIREYYIDNYSDESVDDDDIMMGENGFEDDGSIFSKISNELSSDLDMKTEKGQAIFKARLVAYEEKVGSEEYLSGLRKTYQGPSLRTPLTNDMAYTNIIQDTNFKLKLRGQTVTSANEAYDITIEDRDLNALGNTQHTTGAENANLDKIPGTNQDATITAQIIAQRLAKEGNSVIADLLMQEGGLEKAGQLVLDETAKQSLNKDSQGSEVDYTVLAENIERRIIDPKGYEEETGQTDVNQNSNDLVNSSFDPSLEDQATGASLGEFDPDNYTTQADKDAALAKHEARLATALLDYPTIEENEAAALEESPAASELKDKRSRQMAMAEKALTGLKAAAGLTSLSKALQEPDIKTPQVSNLVKEALGKQKQLSTMGLNAAEKASAMQGINEAYSGAIKNILGASGGQRGSFLANQGVADANRVKGLLQLSAQDAAVRRQNVGQYNQLASSVGQMQLSADMSAEQMKQQAIAQNKQMLGGIGSNLLSDAISDATYYLNPNREHMDEMMKQYMESTTGNNGYTPPTDPDKIGMNDPSMTDKERKAEAARVALEKKNNALT